MTAPRPLSSGTPGRSEYSHGRGRAPHPDSDFQAGAMLPFSEANRNQGSKRGGFTQAMRQQAELRLDATVGDEFTENMLYGFGNPDTGVPGQRIVQEKMVKRSGSYRQPIRKYGVERQG